MCASATNSALRQATYLAMPPIPMPSAMPKPPKAHIRPVIALMADNRTSIRAACDNPEQNNASRSRAQAALVAVTPVMMATSAHTRKLNQVHETVQPLCAVPDKQRNSPQSLSFSSANLARESGPAWLVAGRALLPRARPTQRELLLKRVRRAADLNGYEHCCEQDSARHKTAPSEPRRARNDMAARASVRQLRTIS